MERIGPYEPLAELGRGGMGVVLRARCARTGREVALKLLQAGSPDAREGAVARFDQEVQALVRLRHPSIVAVLDAGSSPRGPWVAMELVEGESLHARLGRDGPLEPAEAVALGRTLCGALEHAHEMGVLHRDVKPQNVLLARDGRVVLVDFGLARVLGRESRLTLTGEVMGTPCYMAPEQADGATCGPAADVYGLGATLYHALTGQPPLRGRNEIELLHRVLSVAPERPEALRPGLAPALGDVVMRCLEKDPALRPASAAALAGALERASAAPSRPRRRRRRVLVPAAALLGVAVAGATVVEARSAARALDEATRRAAPDATSLVMRARAQVRLGDAAGGLASAEAALELDPGSAAARCQRANALFVLDRTAEALADCASLLARDDVDSRLLADAALLASLSEDEALAVALARRAEQLEPTRLQPLAARVLIDALVRQEGGRGEALAIADRLLEDRRLKLHDALYVLALLVQAEEPRAQALVERGLERWPESDALLGLRAFALLGRGELDASLAAWTAVLERSPDNADALNARAQLRAERRDVAGAAEDAARAVELNPTDDVMWELLARVHEFRGEPAPAEVALTRVIELRPGSGELHLRRAEARTRLGRAGDALADLELSVRFAPAHGAGWVNLSYARRDAGDLSGALAAAERAVALIPQRFEAFVVRGRVRETLGDRAGARRDLQRALELPESERYRDELRAALERLAE